MEGVWFKQLKNLKQYEYFYSEELLLLENPCILAGFRTPTFVQVTIGRNVL